MRRTVKTKDIEGNESSKIRELWFHLNPRRHVELPGKLRTGELCKAG
jgi:hypothetical protein